MERFSFPKGGIQNVLSGVCPTYFYVVGAPIADLRAYYSRDRLSATFEILAGDGTAEHPFQLRDKTTAEQLQLDLQPQDADVTAIEVFFGSK